MTTKQCGNCKFWDRKNAENNISCCLYLSYPKCFEEDSRMPMAYEEGNDCPVYVERQDDAVEDYTLKVCKHCGAHKHEN